MRRKPADVEPLIDRAVRILAAIGASAAPEAFAAAAAQMHRFLAGTSLSPAEVEARVAGAGPIARVRLRSWCLAAREEFLCLAGVVEGHPLIPDGHWARTSPLVGLAPRLRLAVTASGRVYEFVEPVAGPEEGAPERDGALHDLRHRTAKAITGVPQAIASIMTSPNGSGSHVSPVRSAPLHHQTRFINSSPP